YAYEYHTNPRAAYGFIVESTIARGRILMLDTKLAERAPGVRLVMTHLNAARQATFGPPPVANPNRPPTPPPSNPPILYFGQPLAIVVADSFEQARAGGALVHARYDREQAALALEDNLDQAYRPERVGPGFAPDTAVGDFEGAFATAPVKVDATYDNAYQI